MLLMKEEREVLREMINWYHKTTGENQQLAATHVVAVVDFLLTVYEKKEEQCLT